MPSETPLTDAEELKQELAYEQWREVAEDLAAAASHLGWTSSDDPDVIGRTERVLERFRKLKESQQ